MTNSAAVAPLGQARPRFDIRVTRDVVYGRALVGIGEPGGSFERDLKLDVYEPVEDVTELRPAVLMAFGGAFHRGTKQNDTVAEGPSLNTSIADYCAEFATRGFVCMSIDYRLVVEDPDPGRTFVVSDPNSIPRSRVDHVRRVMNLPPATNHMLWRGIEAASDDMSAAFNFVVETRTRWRIDPARIAVGGFSAGARTALNAAYGERVGAAAVFGLSGFMATQDLVRLVTGGADDPPVLLVTGEHDLEYVCSQNPITAQHFATVGGSIDTAQVVGAGHFYPKNAIARRPNGEEASVEAIVAEFLEHWLATRPPD